MIQIITFFKDLTYIGVSDRLDRLTTQKIRVTNGLFFMVVPILIFYAVHNIMVYDGKFAILYTSIIVLGSSVVYLNHNKKYAAANTCSIVINASICFLLQYVFGSGLVLETMILVFVVFSAYIIDNRKTSVFLIISICAGFLFFKYLEQIFTAPYAHRVLPFTPIVFFVFSAIIISYFIFERRNEIEIHLNEKNNFENRLKAKNDELTRKKALIEKQNLELEIKNNELNHFAYIAAHDLKSPVRSVLSFSQLAKRSLANKNYEKVNEFLEIITTSTTHLNDLIQDLLSYSLLEKDSIDLEYVDLNDIYKSALMLIDDKRERPLNIQANGLSKACVNPLQFKLLFQNLIENGIKYNRNEIPEVLIEGLNEYGHHIVKFKDNGIGIDNKYTSQIFEIFKRLHTSEEFEGSGLGLAICKKIIDRHDGSIRVSNTSSSGTEFTLKWPSNLNVKLSA